VGELCDLGTKIEKDVFTLGNNGIINGISNNVF
jgi:hypothetical protein